MNFNNNLSTDFSKLRHYLPEDIRQQNYEEARKRIFEEEPVSNTTESIDSKNIQVVANVFENQDRNTNEESCHKSQTCGYKKKCGRNRYQRILKLRRDYKARRHRRKLVACSITQLIGRDPRPFAEIFIQGKKYNALLDSGASVSVLGKDCREFVEELKTEIIYQVANIHTASGQPYRILGRTVLDVQYKGDTQKVTFYLCPDLEQKMYLGSDFWRQFNIAPEIFKNAEIDIDFMSLIMSSNRG